VEPDRFLILLFASRLAGLSLGLSLGLSALLFLVVDSKERG
jgi:hypothetical protein